MLSSMSAVPMVERPAMPGRSVVTLVSGDRSGAGGCGWMAVGAVSSSPASVAPTVGVWGVRVGARLSKMPQKLARADVR
jgi:hypothetical protein